MSIPFEEPFAIPDKRSLVVHTQDLKKFTDVFPVMKHVPTPSGHLVRLPHTVDTVRIMRNIGYDMTDLSPFDCYMTLPKIKGEYDPMRHQIATARFLSENPRGYCLNQPRTGKTASIIMALQFLRQEKQVTKVLVVAPLSCLNDVWRNEFLGLYPAISVAIIHGTKARRVALLNEDYDVFVINPDGLKVIEAELAQAVDSGRINTVVIDELTYFCNHKSGLWKSARRITKNAKYFWGATGTPGGPLGVYGMSTLVTPGSIDGSFTWWRDLTMYRISQFKWVPRPGYLQYVEKSLSPSICFKKDDIMDLPPLLQLDREAPLSKEQQKAYEELRNTAITEGVTAVNAGVLTSKLMQVVTGAVIDDTGGIRQFDITPRLEVLLDIIKESEYKVIVFAPFTATIDLLAEELGKHYSCAIVDGRVTGHKRDAVFNSFRTQSDPHVLIAHPKTMSFGLELAVADTIVFWGVPLNGAFIYQQAIERINSKLQKSKTPAIIHLHSSPIERRLFKALKAGIDINKDVLNLFTEAIQMPLSS